MTAATLRRSALRLAALLGLCLAAAGCPGPDDELQHVPDVAGEWTITETMGPNDCGATRGESWDYQIQVQQSGASVTVYSPTGTHQGEFAGDELSWAGEWEQDGGTVLTVISVTATDTRLHGTAEWIWLGGSNTCSGTTNVSGRRGSSDPVPQPPPPPPPAGGCAPATADCIVSCDGSSSCTDRCLAADPQCVSCLQGELIECAASMGCAEPIGLAGACLDQSGCSDSACYDRACGRYLEAADACIARLPDGACNDQMLTCFGL